MGKRLWKAFPWSTLHDRVVKQIGMSIPLFLSKSKASDRKLMITGIGCIYIGHDKYDIFRVQKMGSVFDEIISYKSSCIDKSNSKLEHQTKHPIEYV